MEKTIDVEMTLSQAKTTIDALSYALSFQSLTIDEDLHLRRVLEAIQEEMGDHEQR